MIDAHTLKLATAICIQIIQINPDLFVNCTSSEISILINKLLIIQDGIKRLTSGGCDPDLNFQSSLNQTINCTSNNIFCASLKHLALDPHLSGSGLYVWGFYIQFIQFS